MSRCAKADSQLRHDGYGLVFIAKYGLRSSRGILTCMFVPRARCPSFRVIPLRDARHT